MGIRTKETAHGDGAPTVPTPPESRAERTLWDALGTLYQWRKFIAGVTAFGAVASIIIALLLPKWYAAEARVLQPEGGGFSIMGMVDSVTGGLGSILGGAGGEYTRYLAILTSRSMMEDVVDEFNLVEVYDLDGEEHPLTQAVEALRANVEFEVSLDFNYLAVRALDKDPERAAAMANYMVSALNTEHAALTSQSARRSREYVQQRLADAESDLDSVRSEIQIFQETHGVIELESQASAFMQSVADLKAEAAQFEVRYRTLAQQYGPNNPRVEAAREARNAARAQVNQVLGGQDELLPVAMQDLPSLNRRYVELRQDELIQAQTIETIYPIYEQVIFQEQTEAVAVQVVDDAVPPPLAAKPSRKLIVIGATMSAFLLACVFALAYGWTRKNYRLIALRLQSAQA
jgi:uncharacterized protein involved in exopolysaccharide biosynthesis